MWHQAPTIMTGLADVPAHPQLGGLAEDQAARRAGVAGVQAGPGEKIQHYPNGRLCFQPGQVSAKAEMRPVREGQVASCAGAADLESVRLREDRRIPVGAGK